jgi:Dolichyl-phosphate-mannose-protein mannosyltransferase
MSQAKEIGAIVLFAILVTAVLTWPLAAGVSDLGRVRLTDGRWSIWVVAWVAHALTSAPLQLYDANIFYPHPHALALSEPNIGAGILAIPAYLAGRNPIAAHNAAVLASFVLAATGTFLLGRYLTSNAIAAAAAAVAFAFCPYVFSHTAHIQLLMTAGLPFTLLAFHRFVDRRSWGRAATLGAVIAAQALSCAYYGILAGLLAAFGVVFFALSRGLWREPRFWLGAAGAAALATLVVLPFFLPHLEAQRASGFARSLNDARIFSANWRSYLASASWAHRWMLPLLGKWKEPLHPGFLVAALGLAGVWLGSRPGMGVGPERRRDLVVFYALLTSLACLVSFGPGGGLYTALYRAIPVFSFLRAPSRFGIGVSLGLAVLMAIAIDALSRRGRGWRTAAAAAPLLVAAELAVVPLRFDRMPAVPAVYRFLANQPRGAVAEFPFYGDRQAEFNAVYMLFSTYHWQPLVNGYSDNFPPDFYQLASTLQSFPSAEAFEALDTRQTRYIIVHYGRYSAAHATDVRTRLSAFQSRLRPLLSADSIELYELIR